MLIQIYYYSGYDIRSDSCSLFSILNSCDKNVIILGVDNSSSVNIDNNKKSF